MLTDRRRFMLSVFMAAAFGGPDWAFAEGDQGLFWRIKTRDNRSGIVFGYLPVAASAVQDVVRDGERMLEQTSHVVVDMNTPAPTTSDKLPPLFPRLSQAVAGEIRDALAGSGLAPSVIERMPGLMIAVLLEGEGQTKPSPAVVDVIIGQARALRRPVTTLLTDDEVKQLLKPVDVATLNDTVDEKVITFMLELRRQVGPIGAHIVKLYSDRKGEEMDRFSKTLLDHGMLDLGKMFLKDNFVDVLFSRMSDSLATSPGFYLASRGMLTGPNGILERFRQQGADISVLA